MFCPKIAVMKFMSGHKDSGKNTILSASAQCSSPPPPILISSHWMRTLEVEVTKATRWTPAKMPCWVPPFRAKIPFWVPPLRVPLPLLQYWLALIVRAPWKLRWQEPHAAATTLHATAARSTIVKDGWLGCCPYFSRICGWWARVPPKQDSFSG